MTCFVPFIPLGSLIPFTPRKTNMSPENHWLEDAFPIEIAPIYGTCSFSGGVFPGGGGGNHSYPCNLPMDFFYQPSRPTDGLILCFLGSADGM